MLRLAIIRQRYTQPGQMLLVGTPLFERARVDAAAHLRHAQRRDRRLVARQIQASFLVVEPAEGENLARCRFRIA